MMGNFNCVEAARNLSNVWSGKIYSVDKYEDVKKITEDIAKKFSFYNAEFVGGKFKGYFIACAPYYDIAFLIYDGETGLQVKEDFAIHYNYKDSPEEKIKAMYQATERALFDVEEITKTPPKNYGEYRRRINFAMNIYSKRYPCVSAWFISKPSPEQLKAKESGFFSNATFNYYLTKDAAFEIDKVVVETNARHRHRLNDIEYIKEALKDEFYNYECMYGGRYEEAVSAVGIDKKDMTPEQRAALDLAYRQFWKEVNERGDV